MSKFFTVLTTIGEAKLANATALGETVKFEKLAIGDGNGELPVPNQNQTALINEVRRYPLNSVETDPENPNWIICEQIIPENVGGWTIREVGIYDVDGDLVAVGNFPETYKPVLEEGSGRTQTVRIVLQVSSTATVELKIDPSVVLATREYVDNLDKAHKENVDAHPQYTKLTHLVGLIGEFHNPGAIAGWIDLRGGTLSRVTDKMLWDYAQLTGLIILQSTKNADPMKYAMYFGDGNGVDTFTLPNHHLGHFTRGAPPTALHGMTQNDAIRNITGAITAAGKNEPLFVEEDLSSSGALALSSFNTIKQADALELEILVPQEFTFDASRVVPTAYENRPYTANISVKIHRGWM